ncbi:transient receptor potential cation channel subfamily A member 1 homolog [Varroa jacobsoni]|nr:transient receptor potential cation channel subfamily A member 1 homolog [Varroa jacobsoni]
MSPVPEDERESTPPGVHDGPTEIVIEPRDRGESVSSYPAGPGHTSANTGTSGNGNATKSGGLSVFSRVKDAAMKKVGPSSLQQTVISASAKQLDASGSNNSSSGNSALSTSGTMGGTGSSRASTGPGLMPPQPGSSNYPADNPVLQIVSEIVENHEYQMARAEIDKKDEEETESSDDDETDDEDDEGEESEPGPDGPVKKRRKKRKKKDENEDEPEEDPFANLSPEEREKKEKELAKMSQKGATWAGQTDHAELCVKIMNMSRRGDWLGVDALLKHCEKGMLPPDLADEATGLTPLMYAVKDSRVGIADKFLDLGQNVNARAKDGQSALHLAAYHVREDMVRLLLNRKADPTITENTKGHLPLHVLSSRATGAAIVPLQLLLRAGEKNVRLLPDKEGNIPLFLAVEVGNHGVCRDLLGVSTKEQVTYVHPTTGNTALHLATKRKDLDIMRFLVECNSPINHQNYEGQTPLHLAATAGDEHAVKLFYNYNADPNLIDSEDRTPLHIATQQGNVAVVELLIDKYKASLHHRTKDGSTLMHIAAEAGRPEAALVFMKKGVPLHMSNKAGAKTIHVAAQKGFVEVVRTLLQRGEHVDVKTNDGHTALHIAVTHGQALVVETLLGFGAAVQLKAGTNEETPLHIAARTKGGDQSAELLIKSGAAVNAKDTNGEIPLHFAAREGHLRTVRLLLADKAIPDLLNIRGESPLHVAVTNCHFEVAQALLDHWDRVMCGPDAEEEEKSKLANQRNNNGENSLHYAATITERQKHYPTEDRDMMRLLLAHGGDVGAETKTEMETPIHHCARTGNVVVLQEILSRLTPAAIQLCCNQQSRNGWAPLLYACDAGHPELARLLIQNGARVDMFDEKGHAALHLAAEKGHEDIVDILLEAKAFVNARSQKGVTPMHMASENGYADIVRKLQASGALIDALSLSKKTPLHLAASKGQLDVTALLVDLGSDMYALDSQGQTPMMLAIENDHSEIVKLFLRRKPDLATMSNAKGFTCAHIAAMKGSTSVIKELMKFNKSIVTSAKNKTTDSTPLHLAAAGGYTKVVKMCLEAGANPMEENSDGDTPLHLAAKNGHVTVARVLAREVPWTTTSKKTGLTALHVAANNGQMDFVREMLTEVQAAIASQPLPDGGGDYGMTALHLAAAAGHEGVVRMLLNSTGINVDAATVNEGMYPLHFAAQGGHLAVASLILSRAEQQLSCVDKMGRTPLHVAAAAGKREMVGLLHSQGAEINAADNMGWTALHYSSKNGFLPVVKILVENGATAKVPTKDGKVPLCLAAAEGHYDIISYLLKKDHDTSDLMEDKHFLIDLMVSAKVHQNKPIIDFILASPAPIDTAVKIARSYELLSLKEKERAMELEEMSKFCDNLANELLSIAASNNNTAALLRAIDNRNTPFLDVLIELQRKSVVAHPAVQKYLTELWMGSHQWSSKKVLGLFLGFFLCPPFWIGTSLFCGHKIANVPIVKFMSYLVSHMFFVMVLSITIINPWNPLYLSMNLIPHWNEWLLLIWLLGMFIAECTNPSDREGLGYIKTVVLFVSAFAIMVHLVAFLFKDDNPRLICLYVRNQLFAVALLLGFLEFLNFLTFHHLFGPWAVIIRDLIKDLMRFLAILLIFLVGFSLNMCAVYQPVFKPDQGGGNVTLPVLGAEFQSPLNTFEMLFFSLFGLVEPDYMPPLHLSPAFSKIIVKVVFGVYMMVTVVVLINLLIAMMSDTYQRIQAQSDTEWKFGRAKLIRNMKKASPSPSPTNVLTFLPELIMEHCNGNKRSKGGLLGMGSLAQMNKDTNMGSTLSTGSRASSGRQMRRVVPLEEMVYGMNKLSNVVDWPAISSKYLDVRRASLSVVESLQHSMPQRQ